MTLNESNVVRDQEGKFSEKLGAAPEVSLDPSGGQDAQFRDDAAQVRRQANLSELRENIHVPLKNPFKAGDQLVIPAGTVVDEKDSLGGTQGQMRTERKRNAKALASYGGYYYHVPHVHTNTSADDESRIILNDLSIAHPYV